MRGTLRAWRGFDVLNTSNRSLLRAESTAGDDAFVSDTPVNAYVFEFTASPTDEFKNVRALVVVDAVTGEVESASVLQNNE